jgi:hypothetical protein
MLFDFAAQLNGLSALVIQRFLLLSGFGVVPIVQFSSKTKSCASLQRVYKKQ